MAIAIYLRLSESDGDLGIDGKNESNSIENQRLMLTQYAESNQDWIEEEILEYVDDGYSGTNFNRPSFQQLIEDAKKGKFHTLIVKDLSRLGRDYIAAGDYIEQIFPLLNIRFIAVNNYYDSNRVDSPTVGFDLAVNNLINTFYSRDLSQKIISANKTKWKQGVSTSGIAPFGYKMDKKRKGQWVIDPDAAKIVRRIFDLALEGKSTAQIAYALNEEKLPCASVYNKTHGNWKLAEFVTMDSEQLWDTSKVLIVLRRYEYTGAMVLGKTKTLAVGSKHRRKQLTHDRIVVEGVNEAIVTHEEFELAAAVIKSKRPPTYMCEYKFPLKGKIRCGNCRNMLVYDPNSGYDITKCSHTQRVGKHSNCCKENYSMKKIEGIVLHSLRHILETMKWVAVKGEKATSRNMNREKVIIHDLKKEVDNLNAEKVRLYEKYVEGHISREVYLTKRQDLDDHIAIIDQKKSESEYFVEEQDELREQAVKMTDLTGKHGGSTELTYEMVQAFIENVYVYDQDNIEICFLFENVIKRLMAEIQKESE